jgi:DNA-nicking Smr family endonuclease
MNQPEDDGPVAIPIDGTLDLHAFSPKDVSSVVDEYLWACGQKGIHEVLIIHGKGKGVLRRIVHARLEKNPNVIHYQLDGGPSGWGATRVQMRPENP